MSSSDEDLRAGDALHARVQALIADHRDGAPRPLAEHATRFDDAARALARHQHRLHRGYARLCAHRRVDPAHDPLDLLPAVPTDAFRATRVATFPSALDAALFRTSGTTHDTRGEHPMRTLATYRDAARTWARATLFSPYDLSVEARPLLLAIAPTVEASPHSSLSRMLGWFLELFGNDGSRFLPIEDVETTVAVLRAATTFARPIVVLGTAFAFVHLIDRLDATGETLALPPRSRVMQTGGFKGRSREVSAELLREGIARIFSLDPREVIGEYGMTELTSQLYAIPDGTRSTAWIYRAPPWVRVRACDPITLAPLGVGDVGIARIEDLGNVESAWAVQTADRVRVHADGGVELLGRLPGAVPRGCSLAIEELLSRDEENP